MRRSDFHYELPQALIAQKPRPRGESRMMVVAPAEGPPVVDHRFFRDFPELLGQGDVLVLNDTRVFPARLQAAPHGNRTSPTEILLVKREGELAWLCLCKPARRLQTGQLLRFSEALSGRVSGKTEDGAVRIQFELPAGQNEEGFWREVESIGSAPLPPYIHRPIPDLRDRDFYQTIYAKNRGAVAAPTAGLHFNEEILERISTRGVEVVFVTLHVGLGTFRPVKVDEISEHHMESEEYEVSSSASERLNLARREGRRIIAAGTTSVRTLESAIRAGHGTFPSGRGDTSIFITPGFQFLAVDSLLTNFHLPESTLLMLVSAFGGMNTRREIYRQAIDQGYLFYSYGDCMFLLGKGEW